MKNLLAICLFCVALGACSKGFEGTYMGYAEIDTWDQKNVASKTKPRLEFVKARITRNGAGATIEFTDTSALKDCNLKFEVFDETHPKLSPEQSCKVESNGTMETFTVYSVLPAYDKTSDPHIMNIGVSGVISSSDSGGKRHLMLQFRGKLDAKN